MRTSRIASLMSSSVRRPLPRRPLNTLLSFSLRPSNAMKCSFLLLECRGLLFDHGHELCDAGILIPAVIDPAQLVRRRLDALEVGGALHNALDKAGLILDLGHVRLGADDDVAHALAGDAVVLGDLGEGQV